MHKAAMTDDAVAEIVGLLQESQRTQFSFWIKEAQRYKQDLVLFYY